MKKGISSDKQDQHISFIYHVHHSVVEIGVDNSMARHYVASSHDPTHPARCSHYLLASAVLLATRNGPVAGEEDE
jgi:hypothetical protein